MIGNLTRNGQAYSNVVNSGIAQNNLYIGKTLKNYQLVLGSAAGNPAHFTKAMIENIKIKGNGRTLIDASGNQLEKRNAYLGYATSAAHLDILFEDPVGDTAFDRQVGSFDTRILLGGASVPSLTSEVKIAGATNPILRAISYETGEQINPKTGANAPYVGMVTKFLRHPWSKNVGGRHQLNIGYGKEQGGIIKRIHIEQTNSRITGVELRQDSTVVHESLKADNEQELKRWERVPQAGWYTLDFVLDGDMTKAFDTRDASNVEFLIDLSGADDGDVIIEYVDPFGNK